MNYDERIAALTMQVNAASREVIIQDRILGQHREVVAELQGRINMLVELKEMFVLEERAKAMKSKKK